MQRALKLLSQVLLVLIVRISHCFTNGTDSLGLPAFHGTYFLFQIATEDDICVSDKIINHK